MQMVDVPGSRVDPHAFTPYWINYNQGVITIGTGEPGSNIVLQWTDAEPHVPDIRHIGLSCWDTHVSYKNVKLLPPMDFSRINLPSHDQLAATCQVPSLFSLASQCLAGSLAVASACSVLQLAELLLPNTADLYGTCVRYVAQHFQQIAAWDDCRQLGGLSAGCFSDVLQDSQLVGAAVAG